MSAVNGNTIEVFFDQDHPRYGQEEVQYALDYLNGIIAQMNVLNIGRGIRIRERTPNVIRPDQVKWPEFEADVNIFLTPRTIHLNGFASHAESAASTRLSGVALTRSFGNPQIAIVNTETPYSVTATTVHEVGHTFRLKKSGITKDSDSQHCSLDYCVMNRYAEDLVAYQDVAERGLKGAIKHGLLRQPTVKTTKMVPTAYCGECQEQASKVGFFRAKAKAGEYVLEEWV